MDIKVLMHPSPASFRSDTTESGIRRVVENYAKYLQEFGVRIVGKEAGSYDLVAVHAGTAPGADVAHCHGLYWSSEYTVEKWELRANADVIANIRGAKLVTVPSRWVAETFERDMRFTPHIVPHGIDWQDWQHKFKPLGYVIWNKNRQADVCNPYPVGVLASAFPDIEFVTTFPPAQYSGPNIKVTGVVSNHLMKQMVQKASVYLATTKETFGIGILEALASGTPVLGFAHGGIVDLVDHGHTGYLARPGDYEDLIRGLEFCIKYRKFLSNNAKDAAIQWTWQAAVEKVADVYKLALLPEPPTVAIIIPSYKYGTDDKVGRAIRSALAQDYDRVTDIVVVDDGTPDEGDTERLVKGYSDQDGRVKYIRTDNRGVANARNTGIASVNTKYVVCLDADDAIEPQFVRACVDPLEKDRSLGVSYTRLHYIKPDGEEGTSSWPGAYDYNKFLIKQNQVPTCCLFRREMWARLGGYNQRYAPGGAGAEDAEFFLRAGAYGWGAKLATEAPLFIYSWLSGHVTGNKDYREPDWMSLHPWVKDGLHPFASMATPKNGLSHLVRSYDEPIVSVIIPVGPKHAAEFVNTLDSLESQTFRLWEVIVVMDGADLDPRIEKAYPYVRWIRLDETVGAGAARNIGARKARASLLLFVDADDWLYPEALQKMVAAYDEERSIIFTDYVGKAYLSPEDASRLGKRLLVYAEKTGEAVIEHHSADFDCVRAQRQPDLKEMYIWCLITSLVPKQWHDEIGGFDEKMPSWEDWDYWIRMARVGKCFYRIEEPLVVYRFYTGERRDAGFRDHTSLVQYLAHKREGVEFMACACKGKKKSSQAAAQSIPAGNGAGAANIMDTDMVLVAYQSLNRGQHKVVGAATKTFYGYRAGGETFYVHRRDIEALPNLYIPVQEKPTASDDDVPKTQKRKLRPSELSMIPGVTPGIEMALVAIDVTTEDQLRSFGKERLLEIKGVGKSRANAIFSYLEQQSDH